jgi:hypothetical protein
MLTLVAISTLMGSLGAQEGVMDLSNMPVNAMMDTTNSIIARIKSESDKGNLLDPSELQAFSLWLKSLCSCRRIDEAHRLLSELQIHGDGHSYDYLPRAAHWRAFLSPKMSQDLLGKAIPNEVARAIFESRGGDLSNFDILSDDIDRIMASRGKGKKR